MSKTLHAQWFLAAFLSLGCFSPALGAEQESRIWTDKSGKHEVRAKLIDVVDGVVRLERPNGDISRVKLDLLCEKDQDYIRDAGKKKPGGTEKPQRPAGPVGLQVGDRVEVQHFSKWVPATVVSIDYEWEHVEVRIDGERHNQTIIILDHLRDPETLRQPVIIQPPSPESSLKTVRPDYTDMVQVVADGNPADHISADPLSGIAPSGQARAVRFTAGQWSVNDADFTVFAGPSTRAMVLNGTFGSDSDYPRLTLLDMQTRKTLLTGPAPPNTEELVVSPGGKLVATLPGRTRGPESDGLVHFWKLDGKKIEHLLGFAPYIQNAWPDLDPKWYAWIDDQHLITTNNDGQTILWDVENAKAQYELLLDRSLKPVLTPGRKHLVVPTNAGVQFYDARTGDLLAVVGSGDFRRGSLAFSPSGKQLAIASGGFLDILDVTTGETTRSFPCEGISSSGGVTWVDEEYLYSSRGLFVHVPLRLIAWEFELSNVKLKTIAGTHWALSANVGQDSMVLSPVKLPPPEAVQAVQGLNPDDLLIVRPGDTICIDVQFSGDNLLAQEVEQALKEGLTEAGMKVADEAPLKLVARKSSGETEKVDYRPFGAFRGQGQEVSVTARIYELELLHDGTPVWQRKAVQSAPHHLQLQEGESIHAAIDRVMKPSVGNFKGRLPSYVLRPEYRKPLGSTKLSPTM